LQKRKKRNAVVVAQVIDLKMKIKNNMQDKLRKCRHHTVMISLILNEGDPGRNICINKKEKIQQELGGFVYTNKIMVW